MFLSMSLCLCLFLVFPLPPSPSPFLYVCLSQSYSLCLCLSVCLFPHSFFRIPFPNSAGYFKSHHFLYLTLNHDRQTRTGTETGIHRHTYSHTDTHVQKHTQRRGEVPIRTLSIPLPLAAEARDTDDRRG